MPRNAAVRFDSASTQAVVRSAQANLSRSTSNHRKHPRKSTKTRGSYLPKPKVLRIQQRYINGQNKSEIAREEKCDRETVTRIVQFPWKAGGWSLYFQDPDRHLIELATPSTWSVY
jgi:hypothetical protein